MPIDKKLPDHPLLVNLKTGASPKTKFVNGLEAVEVKLINAPSFEDLKAFIPEFTSGTWEDDPVTEFSDQQREQAMQDLFDGYLLPTALEAIKLTFIVSGIDLSDVCHLIRHRTLSFSASGTGDRDMRHDDALVKPSIIGSKHEVAFQKLMEDAKLLYSDMMDDPSMPVLDARTCMPRCTANYYYFSGDLKALMAFVRQRKDESIEPETMNIFAIKVWLEICKVYPALASKIDLRSRDEFAIETSKGGRSSNFYRPEPKNDVYGYKLNWFMRSKMRCEMRGGAKYLLLRDKLLAELEAI